MIEVSQLTKRFEGQAVLQDLNLTISPNQVLFILGKSGTGKSVLLKHLVGLLRPDEGTVTIDGVLLNDLNERQLFPIRKICGMVFQYPALIDSLSVYDNILLGIPKQQNVDFRERATRLLEQVGLSSRYLEEMPSSLSFSIQKRVSLARTLATEPRYLLFDEPTTGMDPIVTNLLSTLIQRLSRELKVGCVVVSHDIHTALRIAERMVLLESGRSIFDGSPSEFRASSQELARAFLREAAV